MSGAKKPTRDGPDIFPFRVLYSPTPDITGIFHRRRETAGEKKPHGCRVRRTALVEAFLRRRVVRVGARLEAVKLSELSFHFSCDVMTTEFRVDHFLDFSPQGVSIFRLALPDNGYAPA